MNPTELTQQAQSISRELSALKGAQPLGQQNLLKHVTQTTISVSANSGSSFIIRSTFTPLVPNTIASCQMYVNNQIQYAAWSFRENFSDQNGTARHIMSVFAETSGTYTVVAAWFSNFAGTATIGVA